MFGAKTSPFLFSKFEIEKFNETDIEVRAHEMIDIINIKMKKTYANSVNSKYVRSFKSLGEWEKELLEFVKKYKRENILIMNAIKVSDWNTFKINYLLKKNRIRTIEFTDLDVPYYDYEFKNPIRTVRALFSIQIKKTIFKKIYIFLKTKIFFLLKKILKLYPNYFLVFGNESIDEFNKHYKNRNCKLLLGNSYDYNIYLSNKKISFINNIKKDYALFLESSTPFFLGDSFIVGEEKILEDPLKWEISFDNFCNFIEKKFNLEVFIANHPRVKHKSKNPEYYRGRTVLTDSLCHTSKDARLIINKASTGIAYGVIYEIPIMFIHSSDLITKKPNFLIRQNFLASKLGKTTINIDKELHKEVQNDIFKINKEKYNEYSKNFVSARNDRVLNSNIIKGIL